MKKIALKPEDVSPSLSLGTSLDHMVTIFLPMVALLNFISSRKINIRQSPSEIELPEVVSP